MIYCFDIGGSAIKGGVAYAINDVRPLEKVPTPLHDFDAFVAAIAGIIALQGNEFSTGIAISIAGVVDSETRCIKCANIPCIDGRDLAADLSERLGRRVLVANDADCFVLAEASVGAGRGHRVVFGAILGTGVGGGIAIDGHLLTGAGGFVGEWGHGPVAATMAGTPPIAIPNFPCGCGQTGCIDTVGAARGMERLHLHLHGIRLSSMEIVSAWEAGDANADKTIDCFVDLLAGPLALVLNVIGASVVPVGGGLSNSAPLIARIDGEVRKRILRVTTKPLIVQGQCIIEPGLIGAGVLGLTELV